MTVFGRLLGRQRTRWDATWHTFPGQVDNASAQWTVDIGAVAAAPLAGLPVRLDVEARYPADPEGLPADAAGIARIEDAVRADVAKLHGAYIGRVLWAGQARFTAHLPAQPAQPVAIAGTNATTAYDPHWAYVRDNLSPDDRQHQILSDLAVLGVLSAHGDPLATPREVAHVAYFSAQETAEQAAADLRADGFDAIVERDDEGEYALTALRSDPVAPPRVHEITWAVKETVERHGGMYDGWNCGVAHAT